MATVKYLNGGEPPTAPLMNNLFGAMDDKLTRLLGGRSFFLAQTWSVPQRLCGKSFFFTAGKAIYASRVPGYIDNGGGVARPYNHQQFLSTLPQSWLGQTLQYLSGAVMVSGGQNYNPNDVLIVIGGTGTSATIRVDLVIGSGNIIAFTILSIGSYSSLPASPNIPTGGHGTGASFTLTFTDAFDEKNKLVTVPRVAGSQYLGLPQNDYVGFYEWSLAAHFLMHQGKSDTVPTRYYLREMSPSLPQAPPEKRFRYGVAEIILEGVLNVTIETEWDKYSCFRIHNLNASRASVNFLGGNGSTVSLSQFECATVRRNKDGTYSRQNYFFPFEENDPRFYWFFPSTTVNLGVGGIGIGIGDDGRVANSMQANNLSNPAILFDWIQFFQRTGPNGSSNSIPTINPITGLPNTGAGGTSYANLIEDVTEQCDIYPFYKDYFGDPSNPDTLVGDLIHNKGKIIIIRSSRSKKNKITGQPVLTFDSVMFNGYKTIVADFAAKLLTVTETGGNLVITSADNDNDVWLISAGTNLFKSGDQNTQTVVKLGSITIESAIFEDQTGSESGGTAMLAQGNSAPQLIFQPLVTVQKDYRTWYDIYSVSILSVAGAQSWDANRFYGVGDLVQIFPGGYAQAIQPNKGIPISGDPLSDANWNNQIAYDGRAYFYKKFFSNGDDIKILKWNINSHGLVQTPVILDGGSGYMENDLFYLQGGVGTPAVIQVLSAPGGRCVALGVTYPGDYSSPPPNPNTPGQAEYIYPPQGQANSRRGAGLRMSITIPLKTISGIHKVKVSDLLKLDWWGDTRYGDQNSAYVNIGSRKMTLTPHGLVLNFVEQDSSLPTDDSGLANGAPKWASGNRSLPRNRVIRFRGHGWGFVSELVGYMASGFLSSRKGRFLAARDYENEVIAPNGDDFSVVPLGAVESDARMACRINTKQLGVNGKTGRFWKTTSPGDSLANYFASRRVYNDYEFGAAWALGTWTGTKVDPVAMALLPEMYNALARAANAANTGVPLSWRCLLFNIGGTILDLDPTTQNSGRGSGPGFTSPLGGGTYSAPRPMNQFCSFDASSLFERLCVQLGITVLKSDSFPPGDGHSFSDLQQKKSAPAIAIDMITGTCSGGSCIDLGPPGNFAPIKQLSGQMRLDIDSDLLSTKKILDGTPTGSGCVGTFDPYSPPPDLSKLKPGQFLISSDGRGFIMGPQLPFGDGFNPFKLTVTAPGRGYRAGDNILLAGFGGYYIYVNETDADGKITIAGLVGTSFDNQQMPLMFGPQAAVGGSGTGASFKVDYVQQGSPVVMPVDSLAQYRGSNWLDLNGFTDYRWLRLDDVETFIKSLGFDFSFSEAVIPLSLEYFEDPLFQDVIASVASVSFPFTLGPFPFTIGSTPVELQLVNADGGDFYHQFTGDIGFFLNGGQINPLLASYVSAQVLTKAIFQNIGVSGTLLKFCPTSNTAKALWKMTTSSTPPQVEDINSRHVASPIQRWVGYGSGSPSIDFENIGFHGNSFFMGFGMGLNIGSTSGLPLGATPDTYPYPEMAIEYPSVSGVDFRDYQAVMYNNSAGDANYGTLYDCYETFGILRQRTGSVAPVKVLMAGQYSWGKLLDSWHTLNGIFEMRHGSPSFMPWQYYPAPADVVMQAGNDLTIMASPHAQQRYYALYDLSFSPITL